MNYVSRFAQGLRIAGYACILFAFLGVMIAQASQDDSQIGANQAGLAYRTADNAGKKAILNHHKGNGAPSYAEAGMLWLDDSASPWLLKWSDGTDWITMGAVNASTNAFTPYQGTGALRYLNYATDSGAADAYAVAPSPPITAYAAGQVVTLKPANVNTGTSTINVSSLGAKTIKTLGGANLAAGDLATTGIYTMVYDGTNFVLITGSSSVSNVTNAQHATMAANTVKANATGSSATPTDVAVAASRIFGRKASGDIDDMTLTETLDLVGSAAQGDILYRNGSAWTRLGAGTSGQFLKTLGAGANPAWASAAGFTWAQIDTSTPGAVAVVDFTSIPATYTDIMLVWEGVSSATTSRSFLVKPSIAATFGGLDIIKNPVLGTSTTIPPKTIAFNTGDNQSAAETSSGYLIVYDYARTDKRKAYEYYDEHGGGEYVRQIGMISNTAAIDGLRSYFAASAETESGSNFDAGTFTLYGR